MRNVHHSYLNNSEHEWEKSKESIIECKNCGKKLQTDSIRRHMRNVHNSYFNNSEHELVLSNHLIQCKECGKGFKLVTKKDEHNCDLCPICEDLCDFECKIDRFARNPP